MCSDKNLFKTLKEEQAAGKIKISDGTLLDVKGIGTVKLYAWNGSEFIKTYLSDVLYVPELKFNLFSVSHAMDKGYRLISDNKRCELLDKNGKVRAIAERCNKLYKMKFRKEDNTSQPGLNNTNNSYKQEDIFECHLVNKVDSLMSWHYRFAHQNFDQVKKILTRNNIKYIEDDVNKVCKECLAGKQHRNPFHTSDSRAKRALELVHADVCGPMETTSLGESRYFLLIKDDYSSYHYVYFMKCKSEVKVNIEKFIMLSERETNNRIKILRTDNGLEFLNSEVSKMLDRLGIRHQRSVVYTLQQNGRAEREIRTLVEATRTMIHGMEKKFWAEAVNTAAYALNRTGTSPVEGKTPYEAYFDKSINLNKLKIFGSRVAVHIPKEKREKMGSKEQRRNIRRLWRRC